MGALSDLVHGFAVATDPMNLLYLLIGVVAGTAVGVLPGLGPTATMSLLLPVTYAMQPTAAIIMLAGIYYGTMYGGTITAVLVNIPGEPASVVTTFDGYEMAKQGRAGPALGIAAVGSFLGGLFAVAILAFLAPPLARLALKFGPPEITVLALLGICLVAFLGTRSLLKSLIMAALGLLLATVGRDPITGEPRATFGSLDLFDGLDFVAIAMGLFGIGEVLYNLDRRETLKSFTSGLGRLWPSRLDWRASRGSIARGSVIGTLVGVLPGGAGVIASMVSYAIEKRRAKDPSRFGRGAIEGVAGPETANNASATANFVPLFTLGLPSNSVLALVYGAFLIQGITPGPRLITEHGDIFWGVVASMVLGNVLLLILNIPFIGIFVQMLRVHSGVLLSIVILVTMVGVFAINNRIFDLWVALGFGILGYAMRKRGFEPGPLVLAFVLGSIIESSFRRSLLMLDGDPIGFLTRPISGGLIVGALVVVALSVIVTRRSRRIVSDGVQEEKTGP